MGIVIHGPVEGNTFSVPVKIKYEDSGAEVSSLRKMDGGGVLVELSPRVWLLV